MKRNYSLREYKKDVNSSWMWRDTPICSFKKKNTPRKKSVQRIAYEKKLKAVIEMLKRGKTNLEIAEALSAAEGSIKNIISAERLFCYKYQKTKQ